MLESQDAPPFYFSHTISYVLFIPFFDSPWKDWQITYLKNLQAADLRRRRDRCEATNEMFLAYEVQAVPCSVAQSKPLVLDMETIYNSNSLKLQQHQYQDLNNGVEKEACYARGKLLGFVEITKRPYGIGNAAKDVPKDVFVNDEGSCYDDCASSGIGNDPRPLRPVLTNLVVTKEARKYGIGSKLLDACEQHVQKQWKLHEVVLEVEDYNAAALKFYLKRGYHVLFSDPASRRYDVHGLWLRKVRCRREVLRKVFYGGMDTALQSSATSLVRRMREVWR